MGGGVTFSATPATINIPSGSIYISPDKTERITVPNGIKVLYVEGNYVGVTPGSIHAWSLQTDYVPPHHTMEYSIYCFTHNRHQIAAWEEDDVSEANKVGATIYYSPEINAHTPDDTDY